MDGVAVRSGSEVADGVVRVPAVAGGVLVGHDGSACAAGALRWAAELARRSGWALHVVRSWSLTTAPRPDSWSVGYVPPLPDWEQAVRRELSRHVGADLLEEGAVLHTAHGPAARRLVAAAAGADLLVVGARGRSALADLLLGSVAEHCVRHAPCPVTVVRQAAPVRR